MTVRCALLLLLAALILAGGCGGLKDKPIDDQKINRTMEDIEKGDGR